MVRLLLSALVGAALLVAPASLGHAPAQEPEANLAAEADLPVGKWKVEFANGVTELCDLFRFDGEGHATVDEPRRKSRGRIAAKDGSFVLTFNDDRVERWTPIGGRFVVEHWFPGSRLLTGTPVLGIAERTP